MAMSVCLTGIASRQLIYRDPSLAYDAEDITTLII